MDDVIRCVITFSTVLMMKHSCKENKDEDYSKAELPVDQIDEDLIEQVKEDWLESVFGTESKMSRTDFLEKLKTDESKWILDSESVRQRVKRTLRANGKGVHVLDQMADSPSKVSATKARNRHINETEEDD